MSDLSKICDLIEKERIQLSNGTCLPDAIDNNAEVNGSLSSDTIGNVAGANGTRPSEAIETNTGASATRPSHLLGNDNGVSGSSDRCVTGSVEFNFMQDTPGSVLDVVTPVALQTPRSPNDPTLDYPILMLDSPGFTDDGVSCFDFEWPESPIPDIKDANGDPCPSGCNPFLESYLRRALASVTDNNKGSRGNSISSDLALSATHDVSVALDESPSEASVTSEISSVVKSKPENDKASCLSDKSSSAATNSKGNSALSRALTTALGHMRALKTPQKRRQSSSPSIDPTLLPQPRKALAALSLVTPDKNRIQSEQVEKCGATPAKKAKSVKRKEKSKDEEEYDDEKESND